MRIDFVARVWADDWEMAEEIIYTYLRDRERESGVDGTFEADGPYDSLEGVYEAHSSWGADVVELGAGSTPFYFAVVLLLFLHRHSENN